MGVELMQKLTFTNSRGESIVFGNSAPFILSKIEGTGGANTNIITTKAPGQDGSTVDEVTLVERPLPMEAAIAARTPEEMYSLRKKLSRVLNPKNGTGTLKYENDAGVYEIKAIAEESPKFKEKHDNSRKQLFTVDFLAHNPFWLDIYESKEEIAQWMGDFQFNLEIPSDGIEMGHRESSLIVNINNKGDVSCGMRIEFTALASVVNPSLFNINTREYIKVKRTLESGDKLIINTSFGNKKVELLKNGVTSNVFNYIDLSSTFLQLEVGDNLLRYDAETGIENLDVSIYYRPLYAGV